MRLFAKFIFAKAILVIATGSALSQDTGQTRSITSDDFASQRPSRPASSARRNPRRATYKLVRKGTVARWKPNGARLGSPSAGLPAKFIEIGMTIWKLRPALGSDIGHKLPVNVSGLINMWTAERVSTESAFKAGDRIRLAVESPVSGYLYVLNSEISGDGVLGPPTLIFPAMANEDNSVVPGMLVDIPDQREELPYFIMNPKKANYAGEALAVVISPVPLRLRTDANGIINDLGDFLGQSFIDDAEVFTRTDWKDRIYSTAESLAACGAASRKLERESTRLCGPTSRQLTREDPLPQTIYRVKAGAGTPAIAFINLRVSN